MTDKHTSEEGAIYQTDNISARYDEYQNLVVANERATVIIPKDEVDRFLLWARNTCGTKHYE